MTRKVNIKTPPQGFWLDEPKLPDLDDLPGAVEKYMDDEGGAICRRIEAMILEYQHHLDRGSAEPKTTLRSELDDLSKIIETTDELRTRLDKVSPKCLAVIEYIDAGMVHETLATLNRLGAGLSLTNKKMADHQRYNKQTKPKKSGRDRLIRGLSDLFLEQTDHDNPQEQKRDRDEFINEVLYRGFGKRLESSALAKILKAKIR